MTVKVVNKDDKGTVELTQRVPVVGRSVRGTLMDPDGSISNPSWKWYRGGADADTDDDGEVSATERDAHVTALTAASA